MGSQLFSVSFDEHITNLQIYRVSSTLVGVGDVYYLVQHFRDIEKNFYYCCIKLFYLYYLYYTGIIYIIFMWLSGCCVCVHLFAIWTSLVFERVFV
jgi:hypothetical protein